MSPGVNFNSSADTGIVALVGAGGRESAIAWKLSQSPAVKRIFLVPGNGYTGSGQLAKITNVTDFELNVEDARNFDAFARWCLTESVSLVVIGPEAPIAAGLADHLIRSGIACFGPTRDAARLEWDKPYAKKFFDENDIPNARWRAFSDVREAEEFIRSASFEPLVVKAAGLAAGKGVVVAQNREEACEAVHDMLDKKKFGSAGSVIVVEEQLVGPEVSILCFTDGVTVVAMPAAQDAKRIGDGDTGPNTGGMGAYVPVHPSILSDADYKTVVEWVKKTVAALKKSGSPYVGVLYAGVMLTKDGPKMLEYNCRFGDPEAEVLLPLLEGDLYEIFQSCVNRTLRDVPVKFSEKAAVCIVLASDGYPTSSSQSQPICFEQEPKSFKLNDNTFFFPAAVATNGTSLSTSGGRVVMVVGVADHLLQASLLAQKGAASVKFDGKQVRRDIAYQSISRGVKEKEGLTYKACNVDIDEGDRLVADFIVPQAKQTDRLGLLEGVGGFGGMFDLSQLDYKEAVLVSGTDGVGTKLLIAEEIGDHETIGIDLVAMSVNDILTHNAEPLYFLDYFATGKLAADTAGLVLKGIAAGCISSNCALIGGETAEMPGMYPGGRYDLAGFAVGVAEKSQLLPRIDTIKAGDVVLGIASSGLHSNGYSLVRKVVALSGRSYSDPAPYDVENKSKLGDDLLIPTKIYVKSVLPALRTGKVKGAAHITGGGLTENIPRILPGNMDVVLDAQSWPVLPVFSWLAMEGRVSAAEMARTFNMGIGMVLIVAAESVEAVQTVIAMSGEVALRIGKVVEGNRKTRINGLESRLVASYMSWAVSLTDMPATQMKRKVGVLLSGTGTNMEALVAYARNPLKNSAADVVVIVSNVPDAAGVAKARALDIPVEIVDHRQFVVNVDGKSVCDRGRYDQAINETLDRYNVDVVCLAGYMRICSNVFVEKWRGRCINTHPAILPAFKGKDAVQMALDSKVRLTGCTVHFVEEEVDAGGIILQQSVPVLPDDTHDTLHERIKAVEHKLFPKAMEAVCRGDAVRMPSKEGSALVGAVQWMNYEAYSCESD